MDQKLLPLLLLAFSFQLCSSGKSYYTAAVVEYHPLYVGIGKNAVLKNVEKYEELIKKAKSKAADIIVFPEQGLNDKMVPSIVPDPAQLIAPCSPSNFEASEALQRLSCAAKNNSIYVVVNLREKRPCDKNEDENCPDIGYYLLNSNAVFDRQGRVVARYSKFNLFDEGNTDVTAEPEITFFETDFGVRFGTFICFDLLFWTPTLRLIEQYKITDFVSSTFWFSELPFLTALQAQKGWAESNDVNLLASGVNYPTWGSSGSGIYNGKYGALVEIMPEVPTTKLLVARVPKKEGSYLNEISSELYKPSSGNEIYTIEEPTNKTDNFKLLSDQILLYNSEIITPGVLYAKSICKNDFCCDFRIMMEKVNKTSDNYVYRAMVTDTVRKFGKRATGGVQACAVVACNGPDLLNCTQRTKNIRGIYRFTEINIYGEFLLRNAFQFPSTLTDGKKLVPLPPHKYYFKKEEVNGKRRVSLELVWPVDDLYAFAVWGRDFRRDGEIAESKYAGASSLLSLPLFVLVNAAFLIFR